MTWEECKKRGDAEINDEGSINFITIDKDDNELEINHTVDGYEICGYRKEIDYRQINDPARDD